MSVFDLRDRLQPRLPRITPATDVPEETFVAADTPAFVVEDEQSGRVVLTMPAETASVRAEDFLLKMSGRLVEAETANANGAFWSQGDLEFGLPSIAYGPLNWLHEERKVIGVLTDARMVAAEQAAAYGVGPHVAADAQVWRWLYPREAREISQYSEQKSLWYSMECISQQVQCVGEGSCGRTFAYLDSTGEKACEHLRERSAHRRLVNPIFQGAAVIVPPTRPGWKDADLAVARQAAHVVEEQQLELPGMDQSTAERMVAQVLTWSRG